MMGQPLVWAMGGESHTAPSDTIPAYWAALGSGAHGLAIGVRLTSDGTVVCCEAASLSGTCDDPRKVSAVTAKEIRNLDAGRLFRSIELDNNNQPVRQGKGKDTPWTGEGKAKFQWLYHPTLAEVLLLFSRRTSLMLFVSPATKSATARKRVVSATADLITQFGLDHSATLVCDVETLREARRVLPDATLALQVTAKEKPAVAVAAAKKLKANQVILRSEQFLTPTGGITDKFAKSLGRKLTVLVTSDKQPYALRPKVLGRLAGQPWLGGIICRAVHETLDVFRRPCRILADEFQGTTPNASIWEIGYSKNNSDTKVSQKNGLEIRIKKGGEYSGGAAVSTLSIHGDFDARVGYHVNNPHQGTTFELAAIQVDPGYREINLTFDVHGAPPYASSERDENDGFRIGWNNGPALTKFSPTRLAMKKQGSDYVVSKSRDEAQSSNLYNEYSRDVGYAKKDSPEGELRLVRTGSIFNAYYRDQFNSAWVLSGTALVPTLAQDVFLRLGAKHWPKKGIVPPNNTIMFKRFELFQRRL